MVLELRYEVLELRYEVLELRSVVLEIHYMVSELLYLDTYKSIFLFFSEIFHLSLNRKTAGNFKENLRNEREKFL